MPVALVSVPGTMRYQFCAFTYLDRFSVSTGASTGIGVQFGDFEVMSGFYFAFMRSRAAWICSGTCIKNLIAIAFCSYFYQPEISITRTERICVTREDITAVCCLLDRICDIGSCATKGLVPLLLAL